MELDASVDWKQRCVRAEGKLAGLISFLCEQADAGTTFTANEMLAKLEALFQLDLAADTAIALAMLQRAHGV